MSHYYINDPNVTSKERTFTYTYGSKTLTFTSDNGVFSKDRVDFGTHLLLQHMDFSISPTSILDVGCGIGIIGLSLASMFPKSQVDMIDINTRALALAKKNQEQNHLSNVHIYESNVYENVHQTYDLIITNPPIRAGKKVVHSIVIEGFHKLNNNGSLIMVIQKKQGALSMEELCKEVFNHVCVRFKKNGYFIFQSIKKEELSNHIQE